MAFVTLTFVYSCKKIDQFSQITIPFIRTVSIPATSEENIDLDISTPEISTQENFLSQNIDLENERLESIYLNTLSLIIDSESQMDLEYLEMIELYILSDDLGEEKIAWKTDIPADVGKDLELDVSSLDLTAYILEESIRFRLVGATHQAIAEDHELTIDSKFIMDLKILGQ